MILNYQHNYKHTGKKKKRKNVWKIQIKHNDSGKQRSVIKITLGHTIPPRPNAHFNYILILLKVQKLTGNGNKFSPV